MSRRRGTRGGDALNEDAVTAKVREFYERVRFPGIRPPDQDGLILMRRLAKRASRGSKGAGSASLRILDAGCGTGNTSLSLARRFPGYEFLGVDFSEPSLDLARASAEKEGLRNIRFRRGDLMRPLDEGSQFDAVLCLGVLHHTAEPRTVLGHLRASLRDDGELYLWIYGRHGRYRHDLNRRLLRMLLDARPGTGDELTLAKELIRTSREPQTARDDLSCRAMDASTIEDLLDDPSWVADQFLNPREVLLDMPGLAGLLEDAGFELTEWLGINTDLAAYFSSPELIARFEALPRRERFMAIDLWLKPERYFIVAKKNLNRGGGP